MINKRLIALGDKKPVYKVVVCQLTAMILNMAMIFRLGYQLEQLYLNSFLTLI